MNSIEETEIKSRTEETTEEEEDDRQEDCDDDCQFIFPQRLMSILGDERNNDAICWLPHGRAFIIRNRKIFSEKVMPRFFPRKSKYSSFTRKLNRWNFVRVSSGPELGAYYHEFFLRDKPQLAAQMFCKNARTKIAMATLNEPKPAPLINNVESQMAQPQQAQNQLDPAQMFLMQQQLDPSIQMFIQQQLTLCTQDQLSAKQQQLGMQQQQQQQNAMAGLGVENGLSGSFSRSLNLGNVASASSPSLSLQQHIQAQKEQQARFLQLQQLMALNLKRQTTKRAPKSNNFRASAA